VSGRAGRSRFPLPARYSGRNVVAEIAVSEKDQVSQSYGRCRLSSGFFDDFYQAFFNAAIASRHADPSLTQAAS
jgi:hypothetical protein